MRNEILVRQATIEDLSKIVPLFDSYRVHFQQQSDLASSERFLFEKFEHRESVLFLAEQNGEVIGFAQLYPLFSSLTLERVWLLNDFFIIESFRGQGVGKVLFEKVKEFSKLTTAKGIELSVEHINLKAWKFWENRGFKLDEEFRYYFLKMDLPKK